MELDSGYLFYGRYVSDMLPSKNALFYCCIMEGKKGGNRTGVGFRIILCVKNNKIIISGVYKCEVYMYKVSEKFKIL